jgi:hypothetical protein
MEAMAQYSKILLASQMFEKAHSEFVNAESDMDFINSILLSGAVVGMISPLMEEQGGCSTHRFLTRIGNARSSEKKHIGMYRHIYNSLKHSGDSRNKVLASEDLSFEADLKYEAGKMLYCAKSDFNDVLIPNEQINLLSEQFKCLLSSECDYA